MSCLGRVSGKESSARPVFEDVERKQEIVNNRKTRALVVVLAVLAALSAGCVKRVPLTTMQTVTLDVNQALAGISTLNKAVAQDTIALNAPKFLSDAFANSILDYNRMVAQCVLASEDVLRGKSPDADKLAAVRKLFAALKLPEGVTSMLTGPESGRPQVNDTMISLVASFRSLQALITALVGGK